MVQDSPAGSGMPSSDSLERLLEAARAGSTEALGQVLDGCRHYLLLVANEELDSALQAKGGASDLVQETFLEAQLAFGRFQGSTERELLAWLRRILLHNLANLRRRYRHTEQRQVAREISLEAADHLQGLLAAEASTPSAQAIRAEEAAAFQQALERLPEHYRQVIVWRHREQRSFQEIGQLLGRSPDAARMLWWRAFEQLANELNPSA
jgi:RNA polymerase sigma-70 factor (ECF subfamily)